MNFAEIEFWLKNTIPGIVILSAIGSLAALLVLKIARMSLSAVALRVFPKFIHFLSGFLTRPVALQQTKLYFANSAQKFQAYYTLQIMKFVWCLIVALFSLVLFLHSLDSVQDAQGTLSRPSIWVPLLVGFLFIWWAFRAFLNALVPYVLDMDELLRKTEKQVNERNQDS